MQSNYQLRYVPEFFDDVDNITKYIKNQLRNPVAAQDLLDNIFDSIYKRSFNPEAFEPVYSLKQRQYPFYRIYVKNYVIYYVVITEDNCKIMEVRGVYYGKRNRQQFI